MFHSIIGSRGRVRGLMATIMAAFVFAAAPAASETPLVITGKGEYIELPDERIPVVRLNWKCPGNEDPWSIQHYERRVKTAGGAWGEWTIMQYSGPTGGDNTWRSYPLVEGTEYTFQIRVTFRWYTLGAWRYKTRTSNAVTVVPGADPQVYRPPSGNPVGRPPGS